MKRRLLIVIGIVLLLLVGVWLWIAYPLAKGVVDDAATRTMRSGTDTVEVNGMHVIIQHYAPDSVP